MFQQGCMQKSGVVAALLLLATASPAYSETVDYLDLPPEVLLDAEVMSASKKVEKLFDSPSAIYVISGEDILKSGVTNIADALRMAPGVHVAQSDSNSWAISIRGFNNALANKLLVMIDGRTVYNPIFSGTFWEIQDLFFEDIERIEVIRGPGGTLWGANAVNGIINIITKEAKKSQGSAVTAIYGTNERELGGRHGGVLGDEGFYRVYAKYFDRESFDRPGGQEGIDDWDSYRSGFRADWDENFTLQGDIYKTTTHQTSVDKFLVPPFSALVENEIVYTGANILGKWRKNYSDDSIFTFQAYIDHTRRDEPSLIKDERVIVDMETQYNFARHGRHSVIIGGGYRFTSDDEHGTRNASFLSGSENDSIYNIFIQDEMTLVPEKWFLTLGTKIEHNDFTGFEFQPSAKLQWIMDDRQTIWASVSRAVRMPGRLERDIDFTVETSAGFRAATHGNDNFKSEELVAYEMGYRNQISPAFSVDVAAFYNEYDKLAGVEALPLVLVNNGIDPIHILAPFNYTNSYTGEVYGAEFSANWNVRNDWSLSFNYSFIDIFLHDKVNGALRLERVEDGTPHHQFNLRSHWDINENWSLNTTLHYVDEIDHRNVGDYVRLDANLGWKVNENLHFTLVGQNLLDDAHREFGPTSEVNVAEPENVTEPERAVFGRLTWKF